MPEEPPEACEVVDLPDVGEAALVVVRPALADPASAAVHVLLDGTGAGRRRPGWPDGSRCTSARRSRWASPTTPPAAPAAGGRHGAGAGKLGVAATELTELDVEPAAAVLPEGVAVRQARGRRRWGVRPAPSDEDDDLQQVLARIPAQR